MQTLHPVSSLEAVLLHPPTPPPPPRHTHPPRLVTCAGFLYIDRRPGSPSQLTIGSNMTLHKPLITGLGLTIYVAAGATLTLAAQPLLPRAQVRWTLHGSSNSSSGNISGSGGGSGSQQQASLQITGLQLRPTYACFNLHGCPVQVFTGPGSLQFVTGAHPLPFWILPEWFSGGSDSDMLDRASAACATGASCRVLLTATRYVLSRPWVVTPSARPWTAVSTSFVPAPGYTGHAVEFAAGVYPARERVDLPRLIGFRTMSAVIRGAAGG